MTPAASSRQVWTSNGGMRQVDRDCTASPELEEKKTLHAQAWGVFLLPAKFTVLV